MKHTAISQQQNLPASPFKPLAAAKWKAILYPIVGAFLLPLAIAVFLPRAMKHLRNTVVFLGLGLFLLAMVKALYARHLSGYSLVRSLIKNVRISPAFLAFDTSLGEPPSSWGTSAILAINVLAFFLIPAGTMKRLMFLPHGDPPLVHLIFSMFTSAFCHADILHLTINMLFLWTFGSAVESRIGCLRFLLVYFSSIFLSNAAVLGLLIAQAIYWESSLFLKTFHSIGASGAIFGVMGLFVVRCSFARVTIGLPFLFVPFIVLPVSINSTLFLGCLFANNVIGGICQFIFPIERVNYWAHLGGYVAGMLAGFLMGLHRQGAAEAILAKAENYSNKASRKREAVRLYGSLLQRDPGNLAALKGLFELYLGMDRQKAEGLYGRLVEALLRREPKAALELVEAHPSLPLSTFPGKVLFRLGEHFYKDFKLEKARICLTIAAGREGSWQEKAIFLLGKTLAELDRPDMARECFRTLTTRFQYSGFQRLALEAMESLQ